MTDTQNPQNPQIPEPPAYSAAPAYGAPPPAPPVAPGPPASDTYPGKTLGIVAFVLSFFVQLIALILGIVALVQSKKVGRSNGFAVAAIIISAVLMVIGIIVAIIVVAAVMPFVMEVATLCAELGPGEHPYRGGTITCS